MVNFYTYLELYLDDLRKHVSLSEFEKHFKTPHQTIKSHLSEFVKAKILMEEKKARFHFYYLNLKNPLVKEYLSLCEKERLLALLQKNHVINRLYHTIAPYFQDNNILLFGSAVTSKEYADVDLLIISNDKKIQKELKKFEDTYSIKIHLVQTAEQYMTTTFIHEVRTKHIILNNHDYFIGVLYHNELSMV